MESFTHMEKDNTSTCNMTTTTQDMVMDSERTRDTLCNLYHIKVDTCKFWEQAVKLVNVSESETDLKFQKPNKNKYSQMEDPPIERVEQIVIKMNILVFNF